MAQTIQKIIDYFSNLTTRGYIVWGCGLAVVVAISSGFGYYVQTRNDGVNQELALVQQWNEMEARYSQNRASIIDGLGVANEKRDAINQIIKTAIEGRGFGTDNKNDKVTVDKQKFMSAVQEAYPDLKGLDIYDKLFRQVQAMRKAFAGDQSKMADQIRSFDTWRNTGGLIQPWFISEIGFPTEHLTIRVGDQVYTRQAALDKLSTVIMTDESAKIFNSGKDQQLKLK